MILLTLISTLSIITAKKFNWCCKVTAKKQPVFDFDRSIEVPPRSLISKAKAYWAEMDIGLDEVAELKKKGAVVVHYYSPKCPNSMYSSEHFYHYWKTHQQQETGELFLNLTVLIKPLNKRHQSR